MKKISLLSFYLIIALMLSSCATPTNPTIDKPDPIKTSLVKPVKDPIGIAVYTHGEKPKGHYTVIGKAIVSRFNVVGIKRQKAIINDHLRSIAAAMGGDGIMDVSLTSNDVIGLVIVCKKS
ncbi:MAG: hypothetical protein SFW66_10635 [Gammaproteobacteria bacterium]|nr:hypothetical protein [Gammaproteobacteria bacterium]